MSGDGATLAERLFKLETGDKFRNRAGKRDEIMLEYLARSRKLILDNEELIQRGKAAKLIEEIVERIQDMRTVPQKTVDLLKMAGAAAHVKKDKEKLADGITIDVIRLYKDQKSSYILPLKQSKKGSIEHTLYWWLKASCYAKEINDFHGYIVLDNVPWSPDDMDLVKLNILDTNPKYDTLHLEDIPVNESSYVVKVKQKPRPGTLLATIYEAIEAARRPLDISKVMDALQAKGMTPIRNVVTTTLWKNKDSYFRKTPNGYDIRTADLDAEPEVLEEPESDFTEPTTAGGIPYGKWVTVEDIVKLGGLNKFTIYQKLRKHEDKLQVRMEPCGRGRGRKLVLITEENAQLFYRTAQRIEGKVTSELDTKRVATEGVPYNQWVTVADIEGSEQGLNRFTVYKRINDNAGVQVKIEHCGRGRGRKLIFITKENASLFYKTESLPIGIEEKVTPPRESKSIEGIPYGKWVSVAEILSSGTSYSLPTIEQRLKRNKKSIEIKMEPYGKGRGRRLILVTEENAGFFYKTQTESKAEAGIEKVVGPSALTAQNPPRVLTESEIQNYGIPLEFMNAHMTVLGDGIIVDGKSGYDPMKVRELYNLFRESSQPKPPAGIEKVVEGEERKRKPSPLTDALYAAIETAGKPMTPSELESDPLIQKVPTRSSNRVRVIATLLYVRKDRFVKTGTGYDIVKKLA